MDANQMRAGVLVSVRVENNALIQIHRGDFFISGENRRGNLYACTICQRDNVILKRYVVSLICVER